MVFIFMFYADGTPLASLYLNGTVERSNGTFLPVAPAVVKGSRVYVLTEFVPEIEMVRHFTCFFCRILCPTGVISQLAIAFICSVGAVYESAQFYIIMRNTHVICQCHVN